MQFGWFWLNTFALLPRTLYYKNRQRPFIGYFGIITHVSWLRYGPRENNQIAWSILRRVHVLSRLRAPLP